MVNPLAKNVEELLNNLKKKAIENLSINEILVNKLSKRYG